MDWNQNPIHLPELLGEHHLDGMKLIFHQLADLKGDLAMVDRLDIPPGQDTWPATVRYFVRFL